MRGGIPVALMEGGPIHSHITTRIHMARTHFTRTVIGGSLAFALAAALPMLSARAQERSSLAFTTARVTINGTSNVHAYSASTTAVRVTRVKLAAGVAGPEFWDAVVKPGGIEAFDISVAAAKLSSPKEGLDKNMHKALKVEQFPEITFRLLRLETLAGRGLRATGMLKIAGVEREIGLELTTQRRDTGLTVKGSVKLLMTDFNITPPKAMLGMLKTDPKVTVSFETVLAVPLT